MRVWILLLGLTLAAGAGAQSPGDDWRAWAQRMDKAQRSLNYDATMVIDAGNGDWELVELSQRVGPGGPEQQWLGLNGPGQRQVRTAQTRLEGTQTFLTKQLSQAENADMVETVTLLRQQETAYQTVLEVSRRTMEMVSLFDVL